MIDVQGGLETQDSCAGFEKAIEGCKTGGGHALSEKPLRRRSDRKL